MARFQDRLHELRNERGLSLDELCYRLNKKYGTNLSRSLVSRWENGLTVPDTRYVIALSALFDVSIEYLLGISNDMKLPDKINEKELDRKERRLIYAYREASADTRNAIDAILKI